MLERKQKKKKRIGPVMAAHTLSDDKGWIFRANHKIRLNLYTKSV